MKESIYDFYIFEREIFSKFVAKYHPVVKYRTCQRYYFEDNFLTICEQKVKMIASLSC